MPTYTHTDLLHKALVGYEQRKAEITETIARLRSTLDGSALAPAPAKATPGRKRGTMSPAARKKMSLLMKQRWAKARNGGKKRLG